MEKFLFITFEKVGDDDNLYLGRNGPQRLYYIDFLDKTVLKNEAFPTFLKNRVVTINSHNIILQFIEIFFKSFKYKNIVTERNILSLVGYAHKLLFKKKWIVDIPDCLFKECSSFYRKHKIKWLFSYLKSILAYMVMTYADSIIVSFSKKRFLTYYKGDISKVHFFLNSIPLNNSLLKDSEKRVKNKYVIVYVGFMNLEEYGIDRFIEFVKRYLKENKQIKIELIIIGHKRSDKINLNNFEIINYERLERKKVLEVISKSDVGVVPFLKGSDIYFTYPLKSIEYFVYGNKVLLADTYGMKELYSDIKSPDIYFYDPDKYESMQNTLNQIIKDINNKIFDEKKSDMFYRFDAEKKNNKIKQIYLN